MTEKKAAARRSRTGGTSNGFTAEEKAAMQERARELKAEARAKEDKAAGEADLLAKIAEMPEADRIMAERFHALVMAAAPSLAPRTYYGMPAYAKDGKVLCFFKPASKFKERYATVGFEQVARLDEGAMWPTSYALTALTAADEARIVSLVKKAVG